MNKNPLQLLIALSLATSCSHAPGPLLPTKIATVTVVEDSKDKDSNSLPRTTPSTNPDDPTAANNPSSETTPGTTPAPTPSTPNTGDLSGSGLGKRLLIGYWHNFENGSGFIKLSDVSPPVNGKKPKWDIIDVSFAEPKDTSETMAFTPYGYKTPQEFKDDVKKVQSWGQKVIISIGGEKGQVVLDSDAKTQNFITSMEAIISEYGFDGFDIDFEGHSLYLNPGDMNIDEPTTPVVVNLIKAATALRNKFGEKFLLTMAPETFFVQVGFNNWGGLGNGDNRAGAYLPVIQKLNKLGYLTLLHVQNYNSGPIMGLDNTYRNMGNADFHVSMIEMLIQGFQIAHSTDPKMRFEGIKPEHLAIGLPSTLSAGNGFTSNEEVQKAFLCLEKGVGCGFPLQQAGGYPGLRGLMTWSINWDNYTGNAFSDAHRAFLDSL